MAIVGPGNHRIFTGTFWACQKIPALLKHYAVAQARDKAQTCSMDAVNVQHCRPGDYDAVVEIYNHYIENSHATFDLIPYSIGARAPWFAQFDSRGPHQLLVARAENKVLGYCCSTQFKSRAAYEISVETSAYIAPDVIGKGVGAKLYSVLFEQLNGTGLHGAYAGITLPNDASIKLHDNFGFRKIGVFEEVGRKFDQYWDVAWFQKRL